MARSAWSRVSLAQRHWLDEALPRLNRSCMMRRAVAWWVSVRGDRFDVEAGARLGPSAGARVGVSRPGIAKRKNCFATV
jgi:hypothetical protein